MLIAILSDTHSRIATIEAAVQVLRDRGVTTVIHCGDIEDPEAVAPFAGLETHFVFGNCDAERVALRRTIKRAGQTLHEPFGHLEIEGKRLAFLHGDDTKLMRDVENSGHFDYLFYGHTHVADERQNGPTRVINPGALHRAKPKTFLLLETTTGATESVAVD